MKRVGIIGGMSFESTVEYYRLINEGIKRRRGGLSSANLIIVSLDFQLISSLQEKEEWGKLSEIMVKSALELERAGAECILIATNTMHKLAPSIKKEVSLPLLHIAEATGEAILKQKLKTVTLLGTRFTMEGDFYSKILEENFNLTVVTPSKEEREIIHQIIYEELVLGILKDSSRQKMIEILYNLVDEKGVEGVILGCTEIPLLIKQEHIKLPIFDTTELHTNKAIQFSLS